MAEQNRITPSEYEITRVETLRHLMNFVNKLPMFLK